MSQLRESILRHGGDSGRRSTDWRRAAPQSSSRRTTWTKLHGASGSPFSPAAISLPSGPRKKSLDSSDSRRSRTYSSSCKNVMKESPRDGVPSASKPPPADAPQGVHSDAPRPPDLRADDRNPHHSAHSFWVCDPHGGAQPSHRSARRVSKRREPEPDLGDGADAELPDSRMGSFT